MGPLISLFWTSDEVSPGFQSQGGSLACVLLSPVCNEFLRFTSGVTPMDLYTYRLHVHLSCRLCTNSVPHIVNNATLTGTDTETIYICVNRP